MAIEPIFEKISLGGRRRVKSQSFKVECKTMVSTDSVGEVLSLSSVATVLGCDQKDGQIKCDGRAIFYICYLTVNGEIKKTECTADFSALIKDSCIKAGYKAVVNANAIKTEYDLTGGALGVLAVIEVEAEISETIDLNALSGGERLVIDTADFSLAKSYGVKESVYPIEEEFELNCQIKEVLCHRVKASVTSVNCGVGSIIVDGQVYLTVIALQKADKCSIIKEVRAISFRHEIECDDAMPTMQATASVIEKGLKTDVLVDEESGKSKVTVGFSLCFYGEAWTTEERAIARDAFSITDDIELIKEQAECYKPCGRECLSVAFNGRAGTSELPVGVTMFAVGNESVEIISNELASGKIKVTGVINALGYFCDGEGKPFTRRLETPFEKDIECNLSGELDCLLAQAERVTARLISATEIELDGELILCVSARERVIAHCIKEVKSLGEKRANTHAISVYIPFEDEELWSLAKRLNVCPESLVETNPELTFPLTGKERIVVYRKL